MVGEGRYSRLSVLFYIFHECPTLCSFHWNGWQVEKGLLSAYSVITT